MLPSFNHSLPRGDETGTFLALDVGGSTFRTALVELAGRDSETAMRIVRQRAWKIGKAIKALRGEQFFDWMAEMMEEMLCGVGGDRQTEVLQMGLAWSFPIE